MFQNKSPVTIEIEMVLCEVLQHVGLKVLN